MWLNLNWVCSATFSFYHIKSYDSMIKLAQVTMQNTSIYPDHKLCMKSIVSHENQPTFQSESTAQSHWYRRKCIEIFDKGIEQPSMLNSWTSSILNEFFRQISGNLWTEPPQLQNIHQFQWNDDKYKTSSHSNWVYTFAGNFIWRFRFSTTSTKHKAHQIFMNVYIYRIYAIDLCLNDFKLKSKKPDIHHKTYIFQSVFGSWMDSYWNEHVSYFRRICHD